MSVTLTTAWTKAMSRAAAFPVMTVQLDTAGATSYYFISSQDSPLSTTQGGTWIPILANVSSMSGKVDPVTRRPSTGKIVVELLDEGTGSYIRQLISGTRIRGKRIIAKLGEVTLSSASDYADYFRGIVSDGHW